MKDLIIAFDVDGTLISNSNGLGCERLNLEVYNLMVLLSKQKNTKIIVWSGGGMVDIAFDDQHSFDMAVSNIIVRTK